MQARDRRYKAKNNSRKRNHLIGFGLLGLALLLSHQNCAPAGMVDSDQMGSTRLAEAPLPVTIIDESKKAAGLSFPYGEVELTEYTGDITLLGVCPQSQQDAVFGWQLNELGADGSLGAPVDAGQASCSNRHFAIQVALEELQCGQSYKAVAQLGLGQPAEMVLHRPCK